MNHPFEQMLLSYFRKHQMSSPGGQLVVACSGGADSVALLFALSACARELGVILTVVTIDHGLRDVDAELKLVEKHSVALGHPWRVVPVEVVREKGSLQAGARRARLDALKRIAQEVGGAAIALGHTKNDQAETVLMRLLRGAGTRGLAGMAPVRRPFIRPLLDLERADILSYLTDRGIEWAEDPTNQSDAYTRNRLRREVLPVLESFAPGVFERLSKTAEIVGEDQRALEAISGAALGRVTLERIQGALTINCIALKKEPRSLWPHIFLQALKAVRGGDADLYASHLEALCGLAASTEGSVSIDLPGMCVERVYEKLIFERSGHEGPVDTDAEESIFPGPGCYRNSEGLFTVERIGRQDVELRDGIDEVIFDAPGLIFPLELRPPAQGERMQPFGMEGTKLISDVLVDAKVPRKKRKGVQVLTSAGNVLWLVGVRRAAFHPLRESSEEVIRVRYHGRKKSTA